MMRRTFLAGTTLAPAILKGAKERSWAEIDKILSRGDVKGQVSRDELPTPALVLDLTAFESNIAKMTEHCRATKRSLRPHGKTHKCPEIAHALIRAGAVGACAAKLSEAEVFAKYRIRGILVTTAVIGKYKIERALRLASTRRDTMFCVDNAQNVRELNDAAGAARLKLNLAIDLMVGGRTGIPNGEPAVNLAKLIASLPNVKLAGLQSYAGQASHKVGFEARSQMSREIMSKSVETRRMLEKAGIECPLLTGGSTGTYNIDTEIDGVTEIQPGSFVFMDIDYNRICGKDGHVYKDFQNSLTVRTTVVSKPSDTQAIVDGGLKAFSTDKPFMPQAVGIEGLVFAWGGDEHGRLDLTKASKNVNVGDRIEFIIPHCDPSVNLYDRIYGVRGDNVESVWTIAARGMSQ